MLRSPEDEAVQLSGIEQLFMEQTQAGAAQVESTTQLHQSLEAFDLHGFQLLASA